MGFSKFCTIVEEPRKNEVLLIDWMNLAMRCLHSLPYDPLDENFQQWKLTVMHSLRKALVDHQPTRVIFCLEGQNNWRKEYYPEYKGNRHYDNTEEAKESGGVDYEKFFGVMHQFVEELRKFLCNTLFLQVEGCEADDLIAIVTKKNPNWNITCLSTDRDFYQLYKYKNYKQYNAIKKQFIECLNPENYLLEKVIVGDPGDNVPQMKKRVGTKTAAAIVQNGIDEWIKKEGLEKEFERNMKLISFDCIPEDCQYNIDKAVKEWTPNKFDGKNAFNFMINNDLSPLIDWLDVFVNIFKGFNEKENNEHQEA